jgi:hypothetical protein
LSDVLFDVIQLNATCNGAFSVCGSAQSLSIENSTFRTIKTGSAGGALFLNVSSYASAYLMDTYIANSVCFVFVFVWFLFLNFFFFFFVFIS